MNRTQAYMELLEAVQNYIRTVHSDDHYARDWVLISGVEEIHNSPRSSDIRIDTSPNASNWSIYGLLAIGIDNVNTNNDDDTDE